MGKSEKTLRLASMRNDSQSQLDPSFLSLFLWTTLQAPLHFSILFFELKFPKNLSLNEK